MDKVVIGLGFGDEGKGLVTDYLCLHSPDALVVRFNGGHQAGHTVFTDGVSHIFSNIGSGTLRGNPTYWSKFCPVDPIGLINEIEVLSSKGVYPHIFIDERCPITTPYDVIKNIKSELVNKHGSCGHGYGATIEREENFYHLRILDILYPFAFESKLKSIKKYYKLSTSISTFLEKCNTLIDFIDSNKIEIVNSTPTYNNYIFEGAQGVLLDQNYGFFPNVTRSNTGTINLSSLTKNEIKLFLVTRAYQTRHGNGFMTNENIPHNILKNCLESNKYNKYQGSFRRSLLDVSLLEYAIKQDEVINSSERKNLVITCLDHIENEHRFTYKGKIKNFRNENEFIYGISNILNIKNIYLSHSNASSNIVLWR